VDRSFSDKTSCLKQYCLRGGTYEFKNFAVHLLYSEATVALIFVRCGRTVAFASTRSTSDSLNRIDLAVSRIG